ncbi:DUF4012 domain-containing protein [Candidatus Falkowbacteria bacterium]|nr:DUF4012 domain-containing protein [Candidatus Falkowbacteria bacterium]
MPVSKKKKLANRVEPLATPRKSGSKPAVSKTVKIDIIHADYLSQPLSPHVVNLRGQGRVETSHVWAEPMEEYFASAPVRPVKPNFAARPILPPVETQHAASLLGNVPVSAAADDQVSRLRQEIAALADAAESGFESEPELLMVETHVETQHAASLPAGDAEPNVGFAVRSMIERVIRLSRLAGAQVFISFSRGTVRLVQPFRHLALPGPAKALIGFVIFAVLLVLPIGGISYYQRLRGTQSGIVNFATAAVTTLGSAGTAVGAEDFNGAYTQFGSAYAKFSAAEDELHSIGGVVTALAGLLPPADSALQTAASLLVIGQNVAIVGQNLSVGLAAWEDGSLTLVDKIAALRQQLEQSAPLVEEIRQRIGTVAVQQLPAEQQFQFLQLQQQLPILAGSFSRFVALADFAEKVLGKNQLKRYLLVFQNNHELRPTGGFIGSFALVDIVDGEIRNIEIPPGGSYDLQGALTTNVAVPQPLRLVRGRWEFQDSNWFPDWPTSAEKIIWFYNQSGGPTVDGLIAINASVMEDMLKVLGQVQASGSTVDADNFFAVTQRAVELDYNKEANTPKEFIAALASPVLDKTLHAGRADLLALMGVFTNALAAKDIQLYFNDADLTAALDDFGWSGRMKQTDGDYLAVVNANIGGQKTDAVISQQIFHQAYISEAGIVTDKVTVIRHHQGVAGELFYGVPNVNYLRLYVPAGSTLISASGLGDMPTNLFDIDNRQYQQDNDLLRVSGLTQTDEATGVKINTEFGKTVFGGWVVTPPGERSVVTLEYQLPIQVSFAKYDSRFGWVNRLEELLHFVEPTTSYSLLVQKQSGVTSEWYSAVTTPAGWQSVWRYPEDWVNAGNVLTAVGYLDRDRVYSALFTK